MRRFVPFALFLLLCAAMAVPLLQHKNPAVPASVLIGHDAPLLPGGAVAKKEITIVNFFASWCLPCAAEQKVLMALDKRIDIYGVAYKDKKLAVTAWLKQHGNPYKRVDYDDSGRAAIDWGVYGVPETFIVSKGRVLYRHTGPLTEKDVNIHVDPLLKGAP